MVNQGVTTEAQVQSYPAIPATTLRLDSQNAWRQNENAVIFPILYIAPVAATAVADLDSIFIPIASKTPSNPSSGIFADSTDSIWKPIEFQYQEDKETTAANKQRHSGRLKKPQDEKFEIESFFIVNTLPKLRSKAVHFSKAVPLLLLGAIVLAFFAWIAFR
jgi:hypothetical protein